MIKRLIALFAIAGGIFSLIWFAPAFTLTVGDLPKADILKVKAQDLSLVCPGGVYRTGDIAHVRAEVFGELFNVPTPQTPLAFVGAETIEQLKTKCPQ